MSWIHERDFVRAVALLIEREDISGPVNLAAPNPLPQREFMAALRAAWGTRVGLPATRWMAEIGAFFLRTDTELMLKSRRVVPGRLLRRRLRVRVSRVAGRGGRSGRALARSRRTTRSARACRDLSDTSHIVAGPLGTPIVPWYKQTTSIMRLGRFALLAGFVAVLAVTALAWARTRRVAAPELPVTTAAAPRRAAAAAHRAAGAAQPPVAAVQPAAPRHRRPRPRPAHTPPANVRPPGSAEPWPRTASTRWSRRATSGVRAMPLKNSCAATPIAATANT